MKNLFRAFYRAGVNTLDHDGIEHAGYLAFLGLMAVFPFIVFVLALAGFLAQGQAGEHFIRALLARLPQEMVGALTPRLTEIASGPPPGLLTVSILGAIWTSSSALDGYRTVLNRAGCLATPPSFLWRRLLSILQILLLSFAVVMAMMALVIASVAREKIETIFGRSSVPLSGREIVSVALAVIFTGVSLAYYFLPNFKQKFLSVIPGAALVTVLWLVAAQLLSLYLSQIDHLAVIYGSLGGVIATLLFFFINNIIFIYGAELNYLLETAHGEKLEPKER